MEVQSLHTIWELRVTKPCIQRLKILGFSPQFSLQLCYSIATHTLTLYVNHTEAKLHSPVVKLCYKTWHYIYLQIWSLIWQTTEASWRSSSLGTHSHDNEGKVPENHSLTSQLRLLFLQPCVLCSSPLHLLPFLIRGFLHSVSLSHRWETQLPGRAPQPGRADHSFGIQISANFHLWALRPLGIPVLLLLCPAQASGQQCASQNLHRLFRFLY